MLFVAKFNEETAKLNEDNAKSNEGRLRNRHTQQRQAPSLKMAVSVEYGVFSLPFMEFGDFFVVAILSAKEAAIFNEGRPLR